MIFKRKYFYRDNSIEIFTYFNKSYFLNFENEKIRDEFLLKITENNKNLKKIKLKKISIIFNSLDIELNNSIKIEDLTENWKKNNISNFQFLMILNTYANRSYRDLNQYPILPWLFNNFDNFDEKTLDDKIITQKLNKIIRNMNLPLGMMEINERSKNRKNIYIETFNSMVHDLYKEFNNEILKKKNLKFNNNNNLTNENEENNLLENLDLDSIYKNKSIPYDKIPYFYGSHYSNATYTSHFLTRIFPFTFTMLEIQGGKFDVSERLFLNIINSFNSISSEKCDLREMIPELYFLPELYININKLNLGQIQKENYFNSTDFNPNSNDFNTKENLINVDDVFLPNWSKNNPFKFISFLREIFESENNKINNWIDLIFGVNQTGKKAQINKNIFLPYSYDFIFEMRNKNYELKNKEEINTIFRMYEFGVNPIQILENKSKEKTFNKNKLKKENFEIKYFNKIENKTIFADVYNNNLIILNKENNLINKKKINLIEQFSFDSKFSKEKNDSIEIPNFFKKLLIISLNNNKFFILTGFSNGEIFLISKKITEIRNFSHKIYNDNSIITSIAKEKKEEFFFCGTQKGNILIYNINFNNINIINFHSILNSHSEEILNIHVNDNLNMFISSSKDFHINLHTIPNFHLVNSIKIHTFINNVFLSNSPLPSFVCYSNEKNKFFCFNINGKKLNEDEDFDNKNDSYVNKSFSKINFSEKLISPKIFNDFYFVDYLIYGFNNNIFIRKFPFMNVIKKIEMNFLCKFINVLQNGKLIIVINKNREIIKIFINEINKKKHNNNNNNNELNILMFRK